MSAWLTKNTNALLGLLGVLVVAIAARITPPWLIERLDHLSARVAEDPEAAVAALLVLVGGAASAIGIVRAAWQRDPKAPTTRLERSSRESGFARIHALAWISFSAVAFIAGCSLLSGCTPSQWSDTVHVLKPAAKWSCALANALCVKGSDDVACAVIASACGIVEPLLDAIPATLPATSGDEQPHDLDAEE